MQLLPDFRFVVDEQDGVHSSPVEAASAACLGSASVTVVPSDTRLSMVMRPPTPSMTLRTIARPRPVPVRLVVKKGGIEDAWQVARCDARAR